MKGLESGLRETTGRRGGADIHSAPSLQATVASWRRAIAVEKAESSLSTCEGAVGKAEDVSHKKDQT